MKYLMIFENFENDDIYMNHVNSIKNRAHKHRKAKTGFIRESNDFPEIDIEFLLEAFSDIKDEFDLYHLDINPLSVGYMFVNDNNWKGNGFMYEYSEPRDKDSKYYQDRRGSFRIRIFYKKKGTGFLGKIGKMAEEYSNHVKQYCKNMGQEVEFHYNQNHYECGYRDDDKVEVYLIKLDFDIWTPLFHETPYGRTINMLKKLGYDKDDEMKSKLDTIYK